MGKTTLEHIFLRGLRCSPVVAIPIMLHNFLFICRYTFYHRYTTRPVVTYGSESWTLTVEVERTLAIFERKILRKIYGPVKDNELWRVRRNDELEIIIKGKNVVRFISHISETDFTSVASLLIFFVC
jgi:hypothetical protein